MWVRTDLGGMSDTTQQMSWQTIRDWQVQMFFYSCYLYYVLDNPKLDDAGFDRIVDIMEAHFDELPERITHTVGPGQIKVRYQNKTDDDKLRFPVIVTFWKGKRDL